MSYGIIERELYVEASPDIVFDVVSRPEHVKKWWPDDARYEPTPGSTGQISFGGDKVETLTVVEVKRPHLFSFRWTHPAGAAADENNSLLVTFELSPHGDGTLLRFTESGFREETMYREHVTGWNLFLPRIAPYAAEL